jgi:hypothetical protein
VQSPPTGWSLDTPSRVNTRVITLKRLRRRTFAPRPSHSSSMLLCERGVSDPLRNSMA